MGSIAGGVAGQMAANQLGNGFIDDVKKIGRKVRHGVHKIAHSKEMRAIANHSRPALRELKKIGKQALHQAVADAHMGLAGDNPYANAALSVVANQARNDIHGMGFNKSLPLGVSSEKLVKVGGPSTIASELRPKTGTGVRKGRFAKGSAEAKAWGEKMRALRGNKSGGSFIFNLMTE
jgi:hypothetical protein